MLNLYICCIHIYYFSILEQIKNILMTPIEVYRLQKNIIGLRLSKS